MSSNLSHGVVLGVDTAFTVTMAGTTKVYPSAEKLFPLGMRPIGMATYGAGEFGGRVIGSYVAEFEVTNQAILAGDADVGAVAEALRIFFLAEYMKAVVPPLEAAKGKPFAEIPESERPGLGLVIGGFSPKEYLSEVWNVLIPLHADAGTAVRVRGPGEFATNWFALSEPIQRYFLGWDNVLVANVVAHINASRATPMTDAEVASLLAVFQARQYQIPTGMMPMPVAIDFVRFLVDLVINHHKFEIAASGVGGLARVGMATYRGGPFRIVE